MSADTQGAAGGTSLFRDAALTKSLTPSKMDLSAEVLRAPQWMLLAAGLAVVVTGLLVSFFLPVPVKVEANGILITTQGLKDVESVASGRIEDMLTAPGMYVQKGQKVARIEQPDIVQQLETAQAELVNLRAQFMKVKTFQERANAHYNEFNTRKKAELRALVSANGEQVQWLEKQLAAFEDLTQKGFVSKRQLFDVQVRLSEVKAQAMKNANEIINMDFTNTTRAIEMEREILDLQIKMEQARQQVTTLREKNTRLAYLRSPYEGTVVEQKLNVGEMVNPGDPIFSILPGIREDGDLARAPRIPLVAKLYLPAADGKKVQPGMVVQLVPASVKREEFGFIHATITEISALPVTPQGMLRTLKNQKLVEKLSQEGAPLEAEAVLELDDETVSGFKWSSSEGPNQSISAGTLVGANVIVKEQKLIHLFLPALKRLAGSLAQ